MSASIMSIEKAIAAVEGIPVDEISEDAVYSIFDLAADFVAEDQGQGAATPVGAVDGVFRYVTASGIEFGIPLTNERGDEAVPGSARAVVDAAHGSLAGAIEDAHDDNDDEADVVVRSGELAEFMVHTGREFEVEMEDAPTGVAVSVAATGVTRVMPYYLLDSTKATSVFLELLSLLPPDRDFAGGVEPVLEAVPA